MARPVLIAACIAVAASLAAGCGSSGVKLAADDPDHAGAKIFAERCAGCHTLEAAGTQGSTFDVSDREREDGPENIVTGTEMRQVAEFLAKYAGKGGGDSKDKLGAPGPETVNGG